MANYPNCTGKLSVAGYHEFIKESNNCICGCGSDTIRCKLCLRSKVELKIPKLI